MALIDSYKNTLRRKREELAKLMSDKAKVNKKYAEYSKKAQKSTEAANKANSAATAKSKFREAERYSTQAGKEAESLAKIEGKISTKQKDVDKAQKKVDDQEIKLSKKREAELHKQHLEQERKITQVTKRLSRHDRLHESTQNELQKLKQLPEEIVVAFFASNPLDQNSLRLDEEVHAIQEMLRKTKHRDSIIFKSFWATRANDVLQAINETSPTIVQFSGHGSQNDELIFQDNQGNTKAVTKDAIIQTMVATEGNIRLVVFNTCFSEEQAKTIVQYVDAAIGMSDSISDEAARVFSSQFYSSIGFGLSVAKAFEQAKAALMLEGIKEEEIPQLFVRENANPDQLVIVKPEGIV